LSSRPINAGEAATTAFAETGGNAHEAFRRLYHLAAPSPAHPGTK